MLPDIWKLLRTPIRIMDGNWGQFTFVCFVVFLILSTLVLLMKRMRRRAVLPIVLWSVYTALLLMLTLIGRDKVDDPLGWFTKGWDLFSPDEELGLDTMYNLLMFIPWSLLGCMSFSGHSRPVVVGLKLTFFGMLFSLGIELAQLFTARGACQISDVVYNTISAGAGSVLFVLGAGRYAEKEESRGAR